MRELLWHCRPDAIKHENDIVVRFPCKNSRMIINHLLVGKDRQGNTPLHVLAASNYYRKELFWHPAADMGAFNNDDETPTDVGMRTLLAETDQIR